MIRSLLKCTLLASAAGSAVKLLRDEDEDARETVIAGHR